MVGRAGARWAKVDRDGCYGEAIGRRRIGDLSDCGLLASLPVDRALHIVNLVDELELVDGNSDGPDLTLNGADDALSNPPARIGGELEASGPVEFLDGLHQTQVSFLDQVGEGQAAVGVLLGDTHHESEIGSGEDLFGELGIGPVLSDFPCDLDFIFSGEQRDLSHALQILIQKGVSFTGCLTAASSVIRHGVSSAGLSKGFEKLPAVTKRASFVPDT